MKCLRQRPFLGGGAPKFSLLSILSKATSLLSFAMPEHPAPPLPILPICITNNLEQGRGTCDPPGVAWWELGQRFPISLTKRLQGCMVRDSLHPQSPRTDHRYKNKIIKRTKEKTERRVGWIRKLLDACWLGLNLWWLSLPLLRPWERHHIQRKIGGRLEGPCHLFVHPNMDKIPGKCGGFTQRCQQTWVKMGLQICGVVAALLTRCWWSHEKQRGGREKEWEKIYISEEIQAELFCSSKVGLVGGWVYTYIPIYIKM